MEAGLDVQAWIENVHEQFLRRMLHHGLQIRTDFISKVVAAMATGAGAGVNFAATSNIATQLQGGAKLIDHRFAADGGSFVEDFCGERFDFGGLMFEQAIAARGVEVEGSDL